MRWWIGLGCLWGLTASATPLGMQHSGRITDALGDPVEGSMDIQFDLYTQPMNGTSVWTETDPLTLSDGYYATTLGDTTSMGTLDFEQQSYWLGVTLPNDVVLQGRTPLGVVPTAMTLAGGLVATSMSSSELSGTAPVNGRIVFNETLGRIQFYDGARWADVGSADHAPINDSQLVAWGKNGAGSFGIGDSSERRYPTASTTLPDDVDIIQLAAGGYRYAADGAVCVVTSDNAMYCAGQSTNVPDGSNSDRTTFFKTAGSQSWREVAIGLGLSSCAVTTDNVGYCWGRQQYGAIGNGVSGTGSGNVHTPSLVNGNISWKRLSPGGRYNDAHRAIVCGVTTTTGAPNGYCWGRDDYGMLGDGPGVTHTWEPTDGLIPVFEWTFIEPGGYHVCGLTPEQDAYCWGDNPYTQLGSNGTSDQYSPALVSGGHKWADISPGEQHTCGLRTDGVAMCWGRNNYGQLGDGTGSTRTVPTEVVGGKRWLSISSGQLHTCGLDTDHRAWCWGYNANGEIGDGSASNRNVPTEVFGEYEFDILAAGMRESVGITR